MPFVRPLLTDIVDRINSDLSTRISGSATALRRSVIGVLAIALGGAVHLLYGFLQYISLQVFPDTAEADYLYRWASIYDVSPTEATFAQGQFQFQSVSGASIPQEAVIQRSDGTQYTVDAAASEISGVITVNVTCSDSGANGNLDTGQNANLISPIAGVTSQGVVLAPGISGGNDQESDDSLRSRLLLEIRQPPHGGNAFDYQEWGLSVAGVTRVWVYPNQYGSGTVGITFVRDNDSGSIIPDDGEVAAVQSFIDSVRPVTADVTVYAPVADSFNLTIHLNPDTADIRTAVEAELADLLEREAEPGGTVYLSHIQEAISSASGEVDHVLSFPTADVVSGAGHISVLGTVTWT